MSWFMAALALAELSLLVWAMRRWLQDRSNIALLLVLFIILPITIDSLTVASGRWLGFGEPLETLNRVRYAWFVFSMPLMCVICAATLADAGFSWAQQRWIVPVLLAAAVLLGGYEASQAWSREFHAACVFDVQRYVLQVPPGQECAGSQTGDGTFGLPLVVPVATAVLVVTALILLFRRRWPWLAIMCAALVAVVNVPQSDLSTFISYPTDALLTLTLTLTAIKFHTSQNSAPTA